MVSKIWSVTNRLSLLFWAIFALSPHQQPQKNKILKKIKTAHGDIIILHKCAKNHDHMLYCSWDMAHDTCNYFSFWAIFCPFPPVTAQKTKISKKWKKCWEISSFYICVPKLWLDDVQFLRYSAQQTDGQMDKWTDGWKVTYRGGCPT